MILLAGNQAASGIYRRLKEEVGLLGAKGIEVGLAMVIAGSNPASEQYFLSTEAISRRLGINRFPYRLSADASLNEILNLIKTLNSDERVNGILVFLPLPPRIDQRVVLNSIAPEKDVDGLGAISIGRLAAEESTFQLSLPPASSLSIGCEVVGGRSFTGGNASFLPCTPYGVMRLLEHYGIPISGKDVVVVGKSLTVGKSLALMMLAKGATVTVCHRETRDLAEKTGRADILCVAAGKPGLIKADMVKDGAVVVDIGINSLPDGTFAGDVDFKEVSQKASFITPVPGGVGPVTIAILMKNAVISAKRMFNIP